MNLLYSSLGDPQHYAIDPFYPSPRKLKEVMLFQSPLLYNALRGGGSGIALSALLACLISYILFSFFYLQICWGQRLQFLGSEAVSRVRDQYQNLNLEKSFGS